MAEPYEGGPGEDGLFDVKAYVHDSAGPVEPPQSPVTLSRLETEALIYIARRLRNTAQWMSLVLVTPTHKDARITAFLTTWAYEQMWLADTLTHLAAGNTEKAKAKQRGAYVAPLKEAVLANVYGHALTGVQMCERLIDGWMVTSMLSALQQKLPTGAQKSLSHVRTVLARQMLFFAETAQRELAANASTRRLARLRLPQRIFPLGAKEASRTETIRVFKTIYEDDNTWLDELSSHIATLPGLNGRRVVRRTRRYLSAS